jgi:prophage maintenance system killer protein
LIQINYAFYQNSRKTPGKGVDAPIYLTHGFSHSKLKKMILNPEPEERDFIEKIRLNFPDEDDIFEQSAYWYRAFSRGQVFHDANHRTGFFSWKNILRNKDLEINADAYEIGSLTETIKGMGWIQQGEMVVNLKEKDEEYMMLKMWFKDRLQFRQG